MHTVKDTKNILASGQTDMKILKETEVLLRPDDEKSGTYIPFLVEGKVKKLCITYSYSPKLLDDEEKAIRLIEENILRDAHEDKEIYKDYGRFMPLKNLVTLSLIAPSGYRGAAHRQDSEQYHEISCDFASPGFLKGEIEQGQWSLRLDAHAVVSDKVHCRIRIEAEEECI